MGDIRLLFVCSANICRSAFAEVLARSLLADSAGVSVSSAGIHGFAGHPMDPPMAEEALRRGADPTAFRSRRLSPDMVDAADLVLTAEASHRSFILDERPAAFRSMFTLGQFSRLLTELPGDATGRELLAAARSGRVPADAALDVPDPFGRGALAAARAATDLEAVVRPTIARLVST